MKRTSRSPRPAGWLDRRLLDSGLAAEIDRIRVVDTHEHQEDEGHRLSRPASLTDILGGYALADVMDAGMPQAAVDRFFAGKGDIVGQWRQLREYWPAARNTSPCRAVRLSLRELYGVEDLDDSTIGKLAAGMQKRHRPGVVEWMIREKAGIDCCMVNVNQANFLSGDLCRRTEHPGLFLFDLGTLELMTTILDGKPELGELERFAGKSVSSLADWKGLIDFYYERWGKQVVAVKNQASYHRSLRFEDVPERDAEPIFSRWLSARDSVTRKEKEALTDFTFHYLVRKARECRLPVKIHTGYHAWVGYMNIGNTRPGDLDNLFRQYPDVTFDLFHVGYPAYLDVIALAKHFPNVYADMCWVWIIDDQAALAFARHALAALPANKVFGFGGDLGTADSVCGHCRMARDGIALILTEAVREGRMGRRDAVTTARRWLRENAMEVFRVEEKRAEQSKGQPAGVPAGGR